MLESLSFLSFHIKKLLLSKSLCKKCIFKRISSKFIEEKVLKISKILMAVRNAIGTILTSSIIKFFSFRIFKQLISIDYVLKFAFCFRIFLIAIWMKSLGLNFECIFNILLGWFPLNSKDLIRIFELILLG
jgi:hypothetical protein